LFEHLRKQLGDEVELLHDVHERVPPVLAYQLAKDLEPYRLFFLEDPLSPEDVGYFAHLRQQTSTPLAMGELFNNPNEWLPLVSGRLIDFIRIHLSQVGGLTVGRKVAAVCEFFGVLKDSFCTVAGLLRPRRPLLQPFPGPAADAGIFGDQGPGVVDPGPQLPRQSSPRPSSSTTTATTRQSSATAPTPSNTSFQTMMP